MRLLITGTPGVGKTTVTKALAKLLKANFVDVNALIEEKRLCGKKPGEREKTVKLAALKSVLEKTLKTGKNVIVESHLLCEMRLPCDKIVILRCNPLVLEKRLRARKYPLWKIRDNVLSETLDYCLIKALENYGGRKVQQIDFTKPLGALAFFKKMTSGESDEVDYTRLVLEEKFKKRARIF